MPHGVKLAADYAVIRVAHTRVRHCQLALAGGGPSAGSQRRNLDREKGNFYDKFQLRHRAC